MAIWNKIDQDYLNQERSLFEVVGVASSDGQPISYSNPFPVSLGSSSITIIGDVNVGASVTVTSSPENPVHNHITEVGTSDILNVPYLPVGVGTVNLGLTYLPIGISTANGNVVSVSNTSFYVTGIGGSVSVSNTSFAVSSIGSTVTVAVNLNNTPVSSSNRFPVDASISGTIVTTPSTEATDAFGRLRVSTPLTLFDSSHRYRDNNLWASKATGVGATYSFDENAGLINLGVGTASGVEVVRETTKVFSYQPGKSLLIMSTFVMNSPKSNLRQRVGYGGTTNGIYLELDGSTLNFVERNSVTGIVSETRVPQSQWNIDTVGAGALNPSGITLDITKAQILYTDVEWLGLGTVRVGFVIDGKFIHCHSFHHANYITSTYMTTASLPLRYEITNTGITTSSSTLKQVCSSVISEGGYELRGIQQAVGTPITAPKTLTTAGTFYPVVSLRLKSSPDRLDAIVIMTALSLMGIGNGVNYNWQVIASGTTGGGSWTSAGVDSAVEYKTNGTSITGGRVLASGFINSSNQGSPSIDILKEALFKFQLERDRLNGVAYELTLCATAGSGNESIFGSVDWEEVSR